MTNLDIKISITKLMNYSEHLQEEYDEKTILLIVESFADYIKSLYLSMIEESMNSRRYKGKWEPIDDKGYQEYLGTTPTDNILSLISESLEVTKAGYYFIIKFDRYRKYPGSELTLLRVVRAIESGTSDFSARPIFYKIIRNINNHMIELWRGYLLQRGV